MRHFVYNQQGLKSGFHCNKFLLLTNEVQHKNRLYKNKHNNAKDFCINLPLVPLLYFPWNSKSPFHTKHAYFIHKINVFSCTKRHNLNFQNLSCTYPKVKEKYRTYLFMHKMRKFTFVSLQ